MELFAVMLLAALFKGLQPIDGGISGEAAKLAVNGALAVIAAASFGGLVHMVQETIESMQILASVAMPALYAMMAASGQVVSATPQPLALIRVNAACHLLAVLLPLADGGFCSGGQHFDRFRLKGMAKLLKTITVWITGAITGVCYRGKPAEVSGSAVDAAAVKTAKFASDAGAVAGKGITDAAETILACTYAVKSGRSGDGYRISIIFALPFIKVLVVMLFTGLRLFGALWEMTISAAS